MTIAFRKLVVAFTIALAAGCGGGSSSKTATPAELCQAICANEAKLACPNGDEAGCVTGCQGLLAQDKQTFPNCIDQTNAVFSCTGKVATTSIHCSATSSSPSYDSGFCAAELAAFTSCTACNAVANGATTVDETQVAEELPVASATGGTFAPGKYFLTSMTLYTGAGGPTGPSGVTKKQTVEISAASAGAGAIIVQSVLSTGGAADEHVTLTGTPAGTTVAFQITCPVMQPFQSPAYTATPTTYTNYSTVDGTVSVFTKQ